MIGFNDSDHTLRLSNSHKGNRGQLKEQRINAIKEKLRKIKTEILENIHENLTAQIGEKTHYFA